jgi:hypothetical protein
MNSPAGSSNLNTRTTTARQGVSTIRSPSNIGFAFIPGHQAAVQGGANLSSEDMRQLRLQQLSQILLYVIELTEEEDF